MSGFTKGPWEFLNGGDIFGPLGGDSGDGSFCDDTDGWQVAEVCCYESFVDGELTELGEVCRKANAHLIAAAPELYEQLEKIAEEFDGASGGVFLDFSPEDIQMILAVLAKARGEQ